MIMGMVNIMGIKDWFKPKQVPTEKVYAFSCMVCGEKFNDKGNYWSHQHKCLMAYKNKTCYSCKTFHKAYKKVEQFSDGQYVYNLECNKGKIVINCPIHEKQPRDLILH